MDSAAIGCCEAEEDRHVILLLLLLLTLILGLTFSTLFHLKKIG